MLVVNKGPIWKSITSLGQVLKPTTLSDYLGTSQNIQVTVSPILQRMTPRTRTFLKTVPSFTNLVYSSTFIFYIQHSIEVYSIQILLTSNNFYSLIFWYFFERQILRKIFGPVNVDNVWRIRNNMEIDKLIEGADIVRFIKAQRIKWRGHIQRMDQARPARKLLD
jgi:hypothetical protein